MHHLARKYLNLSGEFSQTLLAVDAFSSYGSYIRLPVLQILATALRHRRCLRGKSSLPAR